MAVVDLTLQAMAEKNDMPENDLIYIIDRFNDLNIFKIIEKNYKIYICKEAEKEKDELIEAIDEQIRNYGYTYASLPNDISLFDLFEISYKISEEQYKVGYTQYDILLKYYEIPNFYNKENRFVWIPYSLFKLNKQDNNNKVILSAGNYQVFKNKYYNDMYQRYSALNLDNIIQTNKNSMHKIMIGDVLFIYEGKYSEFYQNKTINVINRNIKETNNIKLKYITVENLMDICGINDEELLNKIIKFQKNKLYLYFFGFGGIGNCIHYWLNEIREMYALDHLVEASFIYDADNVEYSNRPRLLYPNSIGDQKVKMANFSNIGAKNLACDNYVVKPDFETKYNYNIEKVLKSYPKANKVVISNIYSLKDWLAYDNEIVSISVSHFKDRMRIALNDRAAPLFETYGQINIARFLINTFIATIEIINLLQQTYNKIEKSKEVEIYNKDISEYPFKSKYLNYIF